MMKRLIKFMLAYLLLTCAMQTAHAAEPVALTYRTDARLYGISKDVDLNTLEKNGAYTFVTTGEVAMTASDVPLRAVYRVRVTGTAQDGAPFEYNTLFHAGQKYFTISDIANAPGVYGPYLMEIIGGGQTVQYQIAFDVRDYAREEWEAPGNPGFVQEGRVIPCEFVSLAGGVSAQDADGEETQTSAQAGAQVPYWFDEYGFQDGAVLYGGVGYELSITVRANQFSGKMTATLTNLQTGEAVDSREYDATGFSTDYIPYSMTVDEPFESGSEFEFSATDGTYTLSERFYLIDEAALAEGPEPEHGEVTVSVRDHNETVDIESLKQGDRYVIDIGGVEDWEDGCLGVYVRTEPGKPYRVRVTGTATDGNPFEDEWADNSGYISNNINRFGAYPGTYGPFLLEVLLEGHVIKQYEFDVVVPHDRSNSFGGRVGGIIDEGYISDRKFVEDRSGKWVEVRSPRDGAVLSGETGYEIPLSMNFTQDFDAVRVELADPQSGEVLAEAEGKPYEVSYGALKVEKPFDSGKAYELRILAGGMQSAVHVTLLSENQKSSRVVLGGISEGYTTYGPQALAPIERALGNLSVTAQSDEFRDFKQYRFARRVSDEPMLTDFSIVNPNVSTEETRLDFGDLVSSANWALYDAYEFQNETLDEGAEPLPIQPEKLSELFGAAWKDMKGFAFAKGFAMGEDGARYYWMPLYYPDKEGEIADGQVYLYVYIVRPGADEEYLADKAFYAFFEDYRTEKLLIADQAAVRETLAAMREEQDMLTGGEIESYETLSENAKGSIVREIQLALYDLGYYEGPSDGIFNPLTVDAVKAYQKKMKLEVTGEADAAMQQALLSDEQQRQMLLEWLTGGGENGEA